MGFKMRKAVRLGPLPVWLNFTQKGFSSATVKLDPFSWNSRTRKKTVDTPGPGYWQSGGKR